MRIVNAAREWFDNSILGDISQEGPEDAFRAGVIVGAMLAVAGVGIVIIAYALTGVAH